MSKKKKERKEIRRKKKNEEIDGADDVDPDYKDGDDEDE